MKLSLSIGDKLSSSEGVWIEFDNDVSFKIKYASPEIIRKLRKGHTKKRWRGGVRIDDTNEDAFESELWDKVIVEWKGITNPDESGKEVEAPCTTKNKLKLIAVSAEHANFIIERAGDISIFTDVAQEDKEIKNL